MRAIVLISLLLAFILVWVADVRKLFYPTLGLEFGFIAALWLTLPVAFLVLTAVVRIVPRFVPPTLVFRHQDDVVTSLNLSDNDKDVDSNNRQHR
jgi:hypothetical protein